jgi:hypothetical protein
MLASDFTPWKWTVSEISKGRDPLPPAVRQASEVTVAGEDHRVMTLATVEIFWS